MAKGEIVMEEKRILNEEELEKVNGGDSFPSLCVRC